MIRRLTVNAFFDELEKISTTHVLLRGGRRASTAALREAAENEMQRSGGQLTARAQRLHQASNQQRQRTLDALRGRKSAYEAAQHTGSARVANKPGLLSRVFGG